MSAFSRKTTGGKSRVFNVNRFGRTNQEIFLQSIINNPGFSSGITELTAGSGITLTPNPITSTGVISATGGGGGEINTLASAGGTSWVLPKTGDQLNIKGITSGAGISLTENANDIEIDTSPAVNDSLIFASHNGVSDAPIVSITAPGVTTLDVSAGEVFFYDYTNVSSGGSPVETPLSYAGISGVAGNQFNGTNLVTFVSIDKTGTIILRNRETLPSESLNEVLLGNCDHTAPGFLSFSVANIVPHTNYGVVESMRQFIRSFGGISMFGLDVTGTAPNNLEIEHTMGTGLRMGGGYNVSANNPNMPMAPSANPVTFVYVHEDASGDLIPIPGQTDVDPEQWNDGGTLQTVPNNNWTVQRVFFFYTSNQMLIYFGNDTYGTSQLAINSIFTEDFVENSDTFGAAPVAYIIAMEGGTDTSTGDFIFRKAAGIRSGAQFAGGTISGASLQSSYDNGASIITTPGQGPVLVTDGSAGANPMLHVVNQFATSILTVSGASTIVGNSLLVGNNGAPGVTFESYGGGPGQTSECRFMELSGSEYVGFKAKDSIAGNVIWNLPATAGTNGQVLTRTIVGNDLDWVTPSGGSGGASDSFFAGRNVNQTIPVNTLTTLVCNVEVHDDGNDYNTGNGFYIIPSDGIYTFSANINMAGAPVLGYSQLAIFLDAVDVAHDLCESSDGFTPFRGCSCSAVLRCTTGQKVCARVFQSNQGLLGLDVIGAVGSNQTSFSGCRLGA